MKPISHVFILSRINPFLSKFQSITLWGWRKRRFGFCFFLFFFTAMDIRNWCNSGCKTVCLDRGYHEIGPVMMNSSPSTSGPHKLNWKGLWMKFKKEKRKIFESDPVHVPYDPDTYSQNFDQGFPWDEPDNLSRSFSMRFADPSRVFLRKAAVSS
ncbi:hypothetical protein PTKIN_Ptkin03bG0250300 [Pterospermum kingtungense]